jgi:endoribonuclease Dicer
MFGALQEQQQTLMLFKTGQLNCLVCTSVAEEGLDLTACRLVVRFNPPARALEFIQSRGRARAANSHMILMLEEGNQDHLNLLTEVRQ